MSNPINQIAERHRAAVIAKELRAAIAPLFEHLEPELRSRFEQIDSILSDHEVDPAQLAKDLAAIQAEMARQGIKAQAPVANPAASKPKIGIC